MMAVLFVLSVLVWLVAAYAFIRVLMSWYGVYRAAGAGQGMRAALELGLLNFPAVRRRVGEAAAPLIGSFRRHVSLFAGCIAVFMALVLINIVSGNAA